MYSHVYSVVPGLRETHAVALLTCMSHKTAGILGKLQQALSAWRNRTGGRGLNGEPPLTAGEGGRAEVPSRSGRWSWSLLWDKGDGWIKTQVRIFFFYCSSHLFFSFLFLITDDKRKCSEKYWWPHTDKCDEVGCYGRNLKWAVGSVAMALPGPGATIFF